MLSNERQNLIIVEVDQRGTVTTADLIEKFEVSPITIRRDLADLADRGLIAKVHGGARSIHSTNNPTFDTKFNTHRGIKDSLARAAVEFIQDGDSVAFSAGTTCAAIATLAASRQNLTVITNSTRIADEFRNSESTQLFVTGGKRTPTEALIGPLALASLERLHFDTLFTSVHAADPSSGLTTPSLEEAETLRSMIRSAHRVVVVFDHSKWGVTALSTFAHWNEVDVVIVDQELPKIAVEELKELVEKVVIAS